MKKNEQVVHGRRDHQVKTLHVVTLEVMASMVELSRSRFYRLVKEGVFPRPLFEMFRHRAVYIRPQQETCFAVRRSNCGMNGRTVRFRKRIEFGTPS